MRQKDHFIIRTATMIALVTSLLLLVPAVNLLACGVGAKGGADYVPQRRGAEQQPQLAQRQPINAAQAREIVSKYVKPINPNLTVGKPNDAGAYFEIDLLSKDGEVVQVIGVDKYTGRLEPLS